MFVGTHAKRTARNGDHAGRQVMTALGRCRREFQLRQYRHAEKLRQRLCANRVVPWANDSRAVHGFVTIDNPYREYSFLYLLRFLIDQSRRAAIAETGVDSGS